jgi:hypothetical protein
MQNKVQIVPDELGNVIRVSQNNDEFGHVRLEQERVTFGNTGWVNRKTVSTLLHGKVQDLRDMGIQNMTELSGKIVVRESLEPFNANDPDRDLKIAGKTGIICCQDGQPIYRKTVFTADMNAEDVLVAHDNGDAIREANNEANGNKIKNATVEEAFDNNKQVDLEDSIAEVQAEAEEEEVVVEEELEDATFEL